jgi:hypothetical protein
MENTHIIPWNRIAVEATAIVGSILLAFAIDAWWEDRQIQIEEQQVLLGLTDEFVANHDVLSRDLANHLKNLQSLEDILLLIEGGPSNDAKSIAMAALSEMQGPKTTDLGNGTLNALLNSGRLEILESRKLRTQLTAWEGVIDEVLDDQNNNAKMVFEIYVPYFVSENYSRYAIRRSSEESAVITRILGDPKFHHLVEIRIGYKKHLTGELKNAIAAAEGILAEIELSIK